MANPKDFGLEDHELEPEVLEHFVWVDSDLSVFHPAMTPEDSRISLKAPPPREKEVSAISADHLTKTREQTGKTFRKYYFPEICAWLRLAEDEKEFLHAIFHVTDEKIFLSDDVHEMEEILEAREHYLETEEFADSEDIWRVYFFAENILDEMIEEYESAETERAALMPSLEYMIDYLLADFDPNFNIYDFLPEEPNEMIPTRSKAIEFLTSFVNIGQNRAPRLTEGADISEELFKRALNLFE